MDVGVALWIGEGITDLLGIRAFGHLDTTVDQDLAQILTEKITLVYEHQGSGLYTCLLLIPNR